MNLDQHQSPRQLELTVTDLKQWAYCPRIPYYHHVMPVEISRTYKMERGRNIEAQVQAMEKRRGFRRYGLESGERRFGVWLHSDTLGLSGKLDLLIITEDACYPVDFKDTEGGVRYNHRIQLAAYAMLIEENLARVVPAPSSSPPASNRSPMRRGLKYAQTPTICLHLGTTTAMFDS